MSYVPINPYISLTELREELKFKASDVVSGSALEDELLRVIDRASRWVDEHTGRDFFFHDHRVTPLTFHQFSDEVVEDMVFLPFSPVIAITELSEAGEVREENADFVCGTGADEGIIIRVGGEWSPTAGEGVLSIKGTFGYEQPASHPVTKAGDTGSQLGAITLAGIGAAPLYWQLKLNAGQARVRLFADAGFAALVAEGSAAPGVAVATTLAEQNDSGISGLIEVTYATDDEDAANVLTPTDPAVDRSAIPSGIPAKVTIATRQVAAAMSGHNRKEYVSSDGDKTSIISTKIPDSVYQMLGRKCPVLI